MAGEAPEWATTYVPCWRGSHGAAQLLIGHLRPRWALALPGQAAVDKNLYVVGTGLQFFTGGSVKLVLAGSGNARRARPVAVRGGDGATSAEYAGRLRPAPALGVPEPQVGPVLFVDAPHRGDPGVERLPSSLGRSQDGGGRALALVGG